MHARGSTTGPWCVQARPLWMHVTPFVGSHGQHRKRIRWRRWLTSGHEHLVVVSHLHHRPILGLEHHCQLAVGLLLDLQSQQSKHSGHSFCAMCSASMQVCEPSACPCMCPPCMAVMQAVRSTCLGGGHAGVQLQAGRLELLHQELAGLHARTQNNRRA